jgi:DNA ligase 1
MDRLAQICEQVASHSSRLRKIAILSDYFRALSDDDLEIAVRFLCCGPVAGAAIGSTLFGKDEVRTLSVGWATLREAVVGATGWDADIYHICHEESGDTGETIGLLCVGRTAGEPLPLTLAQQHYLQLYRTRVTAEKVRLLTSWFKTYQPLTIKYFVKIITGGLRIGLQNKMVEEAVAASTGAALTEVRAANHRLGNLAFVAIAARRSELHTIEARMFHPMEFMLAKPLENAADLPDPANWIVEDKYDGIRSQVHFENGRVIIYSRGMDEVTAAFPELESAFKTLKGSAVLDGEILAWREDRALAFTVLQQRIARKKVSKQMIESVPVAFMAYDILSRNGAMLVDKTVEERRAALEEALADSAFPILLSPQHTVAVTADIDHLFEDARLRGNEGLVLKRRGSIYEPGRRSGAWHKLKRPYATLDVVITAAEQGQGKRATVLSDYTFGVRAGDRFLNVGKAYSGLTDVEIRELTRILRASAIEKFGRVLLVRPEIVLEVAFDGVQKSARHKSGYALRFPRIVRWRTDKTADEADDLDRVKALYESSMNLTASREVTEK